MAKKTKKSYKKPAPLNNMKYGEEMLVGNTHENPESEKRITKRREEAISLLDEFQQEGSIIEKQIKKINIDLKITEKELIKKIDDLKIVQAELERRKEQLQTITKISDNYIDMVCEKFNVKKEDIKIIISEKR